MWIQEERYCANRRYKGSLHGYRIAISLLVAVFLLAWFPVPGGAHSPKEIALSYDQAKKALEVGITHGVDDPGKHYIDAVEIKKNGKALSKTEYKSQPGEATFLYSFPVDAVPGDILEVKASCNKFGSKTVKMTVGK